MTKGQFRWLVTASIAAVVAGIAVSLVGESYLPLPLREYLGRQYDAELTTMEYALIPGAFALVAGMLVSIVGLYRFWRPARPLTVITWALGLLYQALIGPMVEWGLATSLFELSALLNGAIIAVIYLPPGKEWFDSEGESGD